MRGWMVMMINKRERRRARSEREGGVDKGSRLMDFKSSQGPSRCVRAVPCMQACKVEYNTFFLILSFFFGSPPPQGARAQSEIDKTHNARTLAWLTTGLAVSRSTPDV